MKRSRIPLVTTLLLLIFFYLPILVLVVNSFNQSSTGVHWDGFTFDWYAKLWQNREIWSAIRNSLIVAVLSTLGATLLGTAAAFALHRYAGTAVQKTHSILIAMPLIIPEVLMGISLLILFSSLKITMGLPTIIVAHITFSMSYVTMVVLSRLQDFDKTLIEAAMDLGANARVTACRIVLPLLAPGIIAGALLAFTLSVDDYVITMFVNGCGSDTIPIKVYSMTKRSKDFPVINALSTLMLAVTFCVVLITERLTEKKNK